jgi:hypothetical protein
MLSTVASGPVTSHTTPIDRLPGIVVAVVGSDGSGKSTLCRDLSADLRREGRVTFIYFGSGDGSSSWIRWPLVQVRRFVQRSPGHASSAMVSTHLTSATTKEQVWSELMAAARVVWALALAWEKRSKLRRAETIRARGGTVICDRYPQAQVGGIMDGPLLHVWEQRPRGVRRRLAIWEASPYRRADQGVADLVLRLAVDQASAERRRPDHDPADLRRRREIVEALQFRGARFGVVDLDATLTAEDVRRDAFEAVRRCRASGR